MSSSGATETKLPVVLALCLIPILAHIAIVYTAHCEPGFGMGLESMLKLGFVTASAITHWGIYISLFATFGLTLRPGHEALVTTMARRMHGNADGEISLPLAEYTRRVTIAWCYFFACQLSVSVSLFCFAPLVVWSFFVNILDIPLVATMFAAEYLIRRRCLENPPRHSLADILKMISDSSGSRAGKPVIHANAAQPD